MNRDEFSNHAGGHRRAAAAMTAVLGRLSFPISKEDAIREVGDWEIPYDRDTRVPLGDLLRGVQVERFGDVGDATAAVDRHWVWLARALDEVEAAQRRAPPARRAPPRR